VQLYDTKLRCRSGKKQVLPFTPAVKAQFWSYSRRNIWKLALRNQVSKNNIVVLGATSGCVLTVMLSSVSWVHFFEFPLSDLEVETFAKYEIADTLSQGTKYIYINSILGLVIKLT